MLEAREGPGLDGDGQNKPAEQIAEVVGDHPEQQADLIGPDSGLNAGDIIHSVNRTPVTTVDSLRDAMSKLKSGDPVALQIEREGQLRYLAFDLE